jgi:hypothetical protein
MNNQLQYMVSNRDLEQKIHTKNLKIIEYPELEYCSNILDMMPSDISVLVILIETKPNSGHWTLLERNNNVLTYFDSYGVKYDGELKFVDKEQRIALHEDKPYLTKLLNKAKKQGYKIDYNKIRFQDYSPNVNTCGKWVIACTNALLHGHSLSEFQQLMKERKEKTGLPFDQIVCKLYDLF